MDPRAPTHDPWNHESLWAIRWSHGRLTVLRARDPVHAGRLAAARQGSTEDGWPTDDVSVLDVEAVGYLELGVAPRGELNRPKYGSVWIGDTELSWSGPWSGLPPSTSGGDLAGSTLANRIRRVHGRLWSYVWRPSELVLFTALDFDGACAWARRSGYGTRGEVDPESIEAVERLELHLAPDRNGFAPTCYRVWAEGVKVGWPPTEAQLPDPDGLHPDAPLGAEARLPIPSYSRTRAYAACGGGGLGRSGVTVAKRSAQADPSTTSPRSPSHGPA